MTLTMQEWKEHGILIHVIEEKVNRAERKGKLTRKEKKEVKTLIDALWTRLWQMNPEHIPSVKEAFETHFGQ